MQPDIFKPERLDVHIGLYMGYLLRKRGHFFSAFQRFLVESRQRLNRKLHVLIPSYTVQPPNHFQRIVQKMRLNLSLENLSFCCAQLLVRLPLLCHQTLDGIYHFIVCSCQLPCLVIPLHIIRHRTELSVFYAFHAVHHCFYFSQKRM